MKNKVTKVFGIAAMTLCLAGVVVFLFMNNVKQPSQDWNLE